ncbi:MAG: transcriptional regulator, ArsR family [Candidatus Acidoferrum typicum]|nr:transcriptional regulator, ArsR family [Candidatus Acidoferrum typicum]
MTRIYVLGIFASAMLETFRALAEPNRLQIIELLLNGPRPVGDMVDQLGLRQPQVSKHLRVLSEAGLVDVRVDAQRRIYALRPAPLQELEAWVEKYRRIWEGNFQRLDALLDEMKSSEKKHGRKKLHTKR